MGSRLAIDGGAPVRTAMLPYARHCLDEEDIQATVEVLRSDWLTTGPEVAEFERVFAGFVGAREAVTVSSGTAALHAAMYALDVRRGDEVVVPALTFAATANCVVFQGGTPVFADVDPETLLLDASDAATRLTPHTKAVIAVDYTGQPCDYEALRGICAPHGIHLVADACHALGGSYHGMPVGSLAELNAFSFHPAKHVTTGEGGAVTTDDEDLAGRVRLFRNHGITTDHHQRAQANAWFYEMVDLGYNYRMTDMQCALGISQLRKQNCRVERRRAIAGSYREAFAQIPEVLPLSVMPESSHAYHLFVVQLELDRLKAGRDRIFAALRAEGIGVNVHYVPVHLHPFYRQRFGTEPGLCPLAEAAYERILSLPMFPSMADDDVQDVIDALDRVLAHYRR